MRKCAQLQAIEVMLGTVEVNIGFAFVVPACFAVVTLVGCTCCIPHVRKSGCLELAWAGTEVYKDYDRSGLKGLSNRILLVSSRDRSRKQACDGNSHEYPGTRASRKGSQHAVWSRSTCHHRVPVSNSGNIHFPNSSKGTSVNSIAKTVDRWSMGVKTPRPKHGYSKGKPPEALALEAQTSKAPNPSLGINSM